MSGRGGTVLDRCYARRRQFNGTDDEYMEHLHRKSNETMPYLIGAILIGIYAMDQVIGESIHDAYRNAILAAVNGADNVDHLIAAIQSKDAVLSTSGNLCRVVRLLC